MKMSKIKLAGAMVLWAAVSGLAEKPLADYSFIRGVCHGMGQGDEATMRKELGYAQRLRLNSTRIWLNQRAFQQNAASYIGRLRNYVRIAHSLGISVMPILFNGNGLNPQTLPPEAWPRLEGYVKAVVKALKDEPGLLMWDLMNEPSWNDYHNLASEAEKPKRIAEIKAFLAHFNQYVKSLDPTNATTIGHTFARDLEWCTEVDVLSFHDYSPTRLKVEENYILAKTISRKYNKPLLNSEMACVCRANPYDVALEVAERHKVGWYVFQLIVTPGGWGDVHGLVYRDGTIRDPSIIAAIYGWHRNRDLNTGIKENPNREGHVQKALDQLRAALGPTPRGTRRGGVSSAPVNTDAILLAAVDMPRFKRTKGNWYLATPPLNRQENNMGPVDWFGCNLIANLPKDYRVGVINVSVAGAGIELWDKDNWEKYLDARERWMKNIVKQYSGSPYKRLAEMGKLAQKDGVIKGILLHQGESNSSDTNWPAKVKGIYDNLMKDLDLSPKAVPLLAGELKSQEEHGVCFRFNTNILAHLPEVLPNSYIRGPKPNNAG